MSNVIIVDFTPPEKTMEQMMEEALARYQEPELIAEIGDTSVWANDNFAQIKVDGEITLTFARKDGGLDELAKALQSLVQ